MSEQSIEVDCHCVHHLFRIGTISLSFVPTLAQIARSVIVDKFCNHYPYS